jgi:HlyD family secretion protein
MKQFFGNLWQRALAHKIISSLLAILVVWGGYYLLTRNPAATETRYFLAAVQKGAVVTSVSGTGQVSVLNQLDIKPQVSGNVVAINAVQGRAVQSGNLIIRLDDTAAQKAVRDAEANLKSGQLALEKLQETTDPSTLTQSQNDLAQAKQTVQVAEDSLTKDYGTAFNTLSNSFIDLPNIVNGLQSVLNGSTVNGNSGNAYAYADMVRTFDPTVDQFRDGALDSYQKALAAYNQNLIDYKNASRDSDHATIDSLSTETYNTMKLLAEAVKDAKNFLDLVSNTLTIQSTNGTTKVPAILATHESSLQSYTGTVDTDLTNILNAQSATQSDAAAITSGNLAITEKTQSLAKLQSGADPIDIQSAQLAIQQKQNALLDAQQNLAYYSVRAPFDGVVAAIDVKVGDPASPGSPVATIIAPKQIANISLNEVDVAKVKMGGKATLTFSAFPDITMTGTVTQIDTLGTASQGVVDYNVQITFDTNNDQIKPGMSVTAAIITETHLDVLVVIPASAVRAQGSSRYVQVLDGVTAAQVSAAGSAGVLSATSPRNQPVEVGLSSDSAVEITSGLAEGDLFVTRMVTAAAQTAATQSAAAAGGLRIPGLTGGGGGGAFRGAAGAAAGR